MYLCHFWFSIENLRFGFFFTLMLYATGLFYFQAYYL
jgi:hypothetical protein